MQEYKVSWVMANEDQMFIKCRKTYDIAPQGNVFEAQMFLHISLIWTWKRGIFSKTSDSALIKKIDSTREVDGKLEDINLTEAVIMKFSVDMFQFGRENEGKQYILNSVLKRET